MSVNPTAAPSDGEMFIRPTINELVIPELDRGAIVSVYKSVTQNWGQPILLDSSGADIENGWNVMLYRPLYSTEQTTGPRVYIAKKLARTAPNAGPYDEKLIQLNNAAGHLLSVTPDMLAYAVYRGESGLCEDIIIGSTNQRAHITTSSESIDLTLYGLDTETAVQNGFDTKTLFALARARYDRSQKRMSKEYQGQTNGREIHPIGLTDREQMATLKYYLDLVKLCMEFASLPPTKRSVATV